MGALSRAWPAIGVAACLVAPVGACSGEQFDSTGSGGDASVDAATGGVGAGGSAGGVAGYRAECAAAGSAGSAGGDCVAERWCMTCQQMTTADFACDKCARDNCCELVEKCTANVDCARVMGCYFRNCLNISASNCVMAKCQECLAGAGQFLFLASCIFNNCKNTDAGDLCPNLDP
jgi:hypothetical protein